MAAETAGEIGQQTNAQQDNVRTRLAQIRRDTKLFSVLAELARGRTLNRFEAERVCHDHVLNSTISEIEKRGVTVSRREEVVPGYSGSKVRCARYWLDPDEREKAAMLLGWKPWRETS